MHEAAITRSIMDTVLAVLREQNITAVVRQVHLTVGVCQGLVPDSMQMFFDMEKEGTALQAAELVVTMQPMIGHCPACDQSHELKTPILFCPRCGGEMSLAAGKELLVTAIEVDS